VNFVAIPHVVRHVWRMSDPTPPAREKLLWIWWGTFLLGFGCLTLGLSLPAGLCLLPSAIALVAIVRDVQRRQDEQFLDDERRRAVPGPTAEALR
jgi:hypothetical protein